MLNLPTTSSLKSYIKKFTFSSPRIVPGTRIGSELDIDSLICPLRYDIVVRIEFFRCLEQKWDLYTNNLASFLDTTQVKNYYTWFREVAIARFDPELYPYEDLVKSKFIQKIHNAAELWKSMETFGLDTSRPVSLMTGKIILPVNGKQTNQRYFAGGGCHRMSCLYLQGSRKLQPEQYQVVIYKKFQPLDNTDILYKKLPLSTEDYCRFISSYYCNKLELDTVDEILQYIADNRHELLPVVRSVVATIRE